MMIQHPFIKYLTMCKGNLETSRTILQGFCTAVVHTWNASRIYQRLLSFKDSTFFVFIFVRNYWGILNLKSSDALLVSNESWLSTTRILIDFCFLSSKVLEAFPRGLVVKNLPTKQEMWVWSLGQEDSLETEMATHSNILAWRIPWTEEPGRPQSIESQKSQIQHSD